MPDRWLADLEQTLAEDAGDTLAVGVVVLASVAGADVHVDEEERHGAVRRALLLLAAGGDPNRGLGLNGRAVSALAADLDDPSRREALLAGLAGLAGDAQGLPHVSEALHALADAPEIAWRAYACSLLAQELDDEN
ncbi:MAG TPA: hypothetical protein VE596_12365 [Gaiellaceae bacterium]|nr:hypothetical protein [Gaiellaceae bacterium]